MTTIRPLSELDPTRFDRTDILKKLVDAVQKLTELKGVANRIPNQAILINTLVLQEAKDSSEIENIVTTHDELYRDAASTEQTMNHAAKEVANYATALRTGFELVKKDGLLTNAHILRIQEVLEQNDAGYRTQAGTRLISNTGLVIYTPPQDPAEVRRHMGELERFINESPALSIHPLIRMALIHHQFESIHPFFDGNGRTGRILNVLYLVKEGLLDIPVLYMSRAIVRTKSDYYRLLQAVRDDDRWEEWVLYMLAAVETSAADGIGTIHAILDELLRTKHQIRSQFRFYSQDLINNLFSHPYTKVEFVMRDLGVSRITATRYLDELAGSGILLKRKVGRTNYYINESLVSLLTGGKM
jgi:Fic family protein